MVNEDVGDEAAKAGHGRRCGVVVVEPDGGEGIPSPNVECLKPERYNRSWGLIEHVM